MRTNLVVWGASQLHQIGRHASSHHRIDDCCTYGAGFWRRFQNGGSTCGYCVNKAGRGNSEGEIPRSGDEGDRVRVPLEAFDARFLRQCQMCGIGGEINRLADLRIALTQCLTGRCCHDG